MILDDRRLMMALDIRAARNDFRLGLITLKEKDDFIVARGWGVGSKMIAENVSHLQSEDDR